MRKLLILLFFVSLLVGCSKNNVPSQYDKKSEKTFQLGVNGETTFKNIMKKHAKVINLDSCYTKYGHSEIFFDISFDISKERKKYAIFSVPANDTATETYFDFEVKKKDDSYPNFAIRKYNKDNSANIKFSLYRDNKLLNVSDMPQIVSGEPCIYTVKVSGEFKRYRQENLAVIGIETAISENEEYVQKYINSLSPDMINIAEDNTAYIIAYPWRTIKVKIEEEGNSGVFGADKIDYEEIIKWSNEKVFNQAICKLEMVDRKVKDYDCKIVFSNLSGSERTVFYDENNKEHSRFSSKKLSYAKVTTDKNHSCDETDYNRDFAYAVAYLLGVSLFDIDQKESTEPLNYNLMVPNRCGINLSFRQWNQLHIRERK